MVSTDDEIAALSKTLGARVPFRKSEATSDDYAGTADVIEEVLSEYIKRGCNFTYACCIYPTAPFNTVEKLKEGFRLLKKTGADQVMPVARFSYPIQRAFKIEENKLVRMWPEYEKSRSLDLITAYHDVGQFYWHNVDSFIKRNDRENYNSVPLIISEMEMQDLDTEEELKVAEKKYILSKQLQGQSRGDYTD